MDRCGGETYAFGKCPRCGKQVAVDMFARPDLIKKVRGNEQLCRVCRDVDQFGVVVG